MIKRTSALLARLVLVLAVFGMSIPAPALMRCLTGCSRPCCAPAEIAPGGEEKKAEPVHSCCAGKKQKAEHEWTAGGHDSCAACKCEIRSATPAVAKKTDSILTSFELPVMDLPVATILTIERPAIEAQVIFATDSSPPVASK